MMNHQQIRAQEVLTKIGIRYRIFIEYYKKMYPLYAQLQIKHFGKISATFQSLFVIVVLFFMKKLKLQKSCKYTFQGLRYEQLIRTLDPRDVMIVGGINEYHFCRKMGCRFHYDWFINRAFRIFIHANIKWPITSLIAFIDKYFSSNKNSGQNYVFLYEDTQPCGLTLACVLYDNPNVSMVCIAHGYDYKPNSDCPNDMNGLNCNFNLVYDAAQAELYDSKSTFVLGLPYEVKISPYVKQQVVLIEHAIPAFGEEYNLALADFIKISNKLGELGVVVIYRARPSSDISYLTSLFPEVNCADKLDLFAEGRMIYVGHNSTLLYEAREHGNKTVALKTNYCPFEINFTVDRTFTVDELVDGIADLLSALNEESPVTLNNSENLRDRFMKCLGDIESDSV